MKFSVRILAGRLDRGAGSHVYHLELARRLASRGHRVSLVCFGSVPEVLDCAEVFELPAVDQAQVPFLWRFAAWSRHRIATRWLLGLDLPPADVVIGGEHLFLKGHRRRFPRMPFIYLPHSMVVSQEIEGYGLPPVMHCVTLHVYRQLQRWALNHSDRTLRFTHRACEVLAEHYGRSARPRFAFNPPGFDLPPCSREEGAGGEVRLLIVGQLVARKRVDTALSALSALRHYSWSLQVVGEGHLRGDLERQAVEMGLGGRVHFRGFHPDPAAFYHQADLLLFPSRSESLGFVLLEAMSHGVPCLAIRADGVNYWNVNEEIIDDGRTGVLADGEVDFGRRLESILRRPGQLARLGQAARRHVAENHAWDRHIDRYEGLFGEMLAEGRSSAREGI
jgi:glycosyltransferase involved in cell wall biosynthesis